MKVPKWPIADGRELELLGEVLASDRWGGYHPFVGQLEQSFAELSRCRHGLAAVNGTVTLEMALEALGIGPGDEVIVPAISFVSTATAVSRVGAIPVFVDIEGDTFNIDPERVRAAISQRVKAVIAVHFGGPMADMTRLAEIARDHDLYLLEDAAHAAGSEWDGSRAGSIGVAGSFSFQNSKVITAGEGGMLTTNNDSVSASARSILDQGRKPNEGWFFHYELGTNYRMTGLQAAVLIAQLERLPHQNAIRARNADVVRRALADLPCLRFQHVPRAASVHTNYLLLGRIPNRDRFHREVTSRGVPCTPFYPHPLYGNPLYQRGGCRVEPCPVSEQCVRDAFWLPHRVLLGSEQDTADLIEVLRGAATTA
jgi:dTDP-4-amino-4,6-dideoxygalactose transaminase